MRAVYLTVEISPGTPLRDACREAIRLARQLGIAIQFDFNRVHLTAFETSSLEKLEQLYDSLVRVMDDPVA